MSAETFTTAMFLITAVLAAGVLINAVFPVVYNMASTFSTATHESDQRMRTDFKVVTYFADGSAKTSEIWMKNIGSARIPFADIARSDVFCGEEGKFGRLNYVSSLPLDSNEWTTDSESDRDYNLNNNEYWDPGETLHIMLTADDLPDSGGTVYFQFILPDGVWRSVTFNAR
jgi:archaeal flagellar protein FlaG